MTALSKEQADIVHAPWKQALQVLASAGSGKTRILTERVRYILANTKKEGIIALTFTNKAAEEMQERLADLNELGTRCWIGTIHAVAQRIVEQYGHTIGLPSELHIYERDQDRKTIFLQSLRENGVDIDTFLDVSDSKTKKDREKIIQDYLDQFSIIKRNLFSETELIEKYPNQEAFLRTFKDYQAALLKSGGLDFDDILVYAHRILLEQAWCGQIYRAKYRHLCIDEAQDLNKAQYEFIKVLCGEQIKSVLMVGDPNQMIYGFNGSSSEFLLDRFVKDFSPLLYKLNENYRSSSAVIQLANKLKPSSQVGANFALQGIQEIVAHKDEQAEAEWICNKIEALIQQKTHGDIEGDITLTKMVVIGRNRFVFQKLEECLDARKLYYSLKKSERQVEPSSVFGKVLDLGIRVRLNPKDWVDGQKLCAALTIPPPPTWGSDTLLSTFAKVTRLSKPIFTEILAQLLEAIQALDLEKPNIPKLCTSFEELLGALKESIDSTNEDELERSLTELADFRKCWTSFKMKGLGETLAAFRNAIALGQVAEEHHHSDTLTLSTVHTMKGLEKDIVFLVGMCEGVFPDYRANTPKKIEEELNNAFVAITRAKRWIFISYPEERMMPWGSSKRQQASQFIAKLKDNIP